MNTPLRLWPGLVLVTIQWLARFVLVPLVPEATPVGILVSLVCGPLILIWWAFFSRAEAAERFGAVVLIVLALAATPWFLHDSIAGGMMGLMFLIFGIPIISLAFVTWAALSRHLDRGPRRLTMVAAILLACGSLGLVRTDGITGSAESDLAWRWSASAEEKLLAANSAVPHGRAEVGDVAAWPGFRGANRDGVVSGTRLGTDWSSSPPELLWRQPVGPGWSSFSVLGEVFFTQEQRGEEEVVSCYRTETGEAIWQHRHSARFWESNGGAGPRATPTLADGRVFALGGTGILSALDASNGSLLWSRDVATELEIPTPGWGFSGSPLVLGDQVIAAVAGTLAAYDAATGEPRWTGPEDKNGYVSPHLVELDGTAQVLLLGGDGLHSVDPQTGSELWAHEWSGYPIVQPALTADGDLLLSVTDRSGLRRLAVSGQGQSWSVEEQWTSIRLKPYFNDFVVHGDRAYGFDGSILAAIDLKDGSRLWKGGRYGHGQMLLLADQDLLLVLAEDGDLALVEATDEKYSELARVPAINGKTWNHPVLVGQVLLVRNAEEMAAFRLPSL